MHGDTVLGKSIRSIKTNINSNYLTKGIIMSKENTASSTTIIKNVAFYKTVWFPWLIITIAVSVLAGITVGWIARSGEASYITSKAEAMASQTLSKDQK
jgi:hypothetical protein